MLPTPNQVNRPTLCVSVCISGVLKGVILAFTFSLLPSPVVCALAFAGPLSGLQTEVVMSDVRSDYIFRFIFC